MIDVYRFFRIEHAARDDSFFAGYRVNGIRSWIYVNIDDFYNWLKNNMPAYYKEVRGRHFFFSKKSIEEDFNSKKVDRRVKAREALNQYFQCCYEHNGLQDFSKMTDLQTMSPVFREVHLLFVHNNDNYLISTVRDEAMCKEFGINWLKDLMYDAEKHGFSFFNDGAGHIRPSYNFRTGFYDSGSTREMQFDKTVGRENTNGVK